MIMIESAQIILYEIEFWSLTPVLTATDILACGNEV